MAATSQIEARSSLFFRSVRNVAATTLSKITLKVSIAIPTVQLCAKEKAEHKAVLEARTDNKSEFSCCHSNLKVSVQCIDDCAVH